MNGNPFVLEERTYFPLSRLLPPSPQLIYFTFWRKSYYDLCKHRWIIPIEKRLDCFRSEVFYLLRTKRADVCFDATSSYGNKNESHEVVYSAHFLEKKYATCY